MAFGGTLKNSFYWLFACWSNWINSTASDIDIWNYASANQCIIVTNDDDFLNLINLKSFPPKVVLLRTGNQSNTYIEKLLIKHLNDIEALSNSAEYGLLEIF